MKTELVVHMIPDLADIVIGYAKPLQFIEYLTEIFRPELRDSDVERVVRNSFMCFPINVYYLPPLMTTHNLLVDHMFHIHNTNRGEHPDYRAMIRTVDREANYLSKVRNMLREEHRDRQRKLWQQEVLAYEQKKRDNIRNAIMAHNSRPTIRPTTRTNPFC